MHFLPSISADTNAVVLVEGASDKHALEALARRRGRNLELEGVAVVSIGGAQAIGNALHELVAWRNDVGLAGLCDEAEEGHFRRALERVGLGSSLTRSKLESLGFYVCVADLEDELIRSLGAAAVVEILDAAGDLDSFRTFQNQPAWRGRTIEAQLRRFFGTHSGRKVESAAILVDAVDLDNVPRPLDGVLAHV